MTKFQKELARHALGLPNERKQTYRNHYCIPPGAKEYGDWEALAAQRLAVKVVAGEERGWSGDFFYLTRGSAGGAHGGGDDRPGRHSGNAAAVGVRCSTWNMKFNCR